MTISVGGAVRSWWRSVGLLVALGGTVTPALYAQGNPSFPGDPSMGRRIFVERGCERCHSIWGNGGTLGPDFSVVGAGRSLLQLAGLFWNHTPRMIEAARSTGFKWPSFTGTELADIISYIYYVKLFDERGDPERGERWFREKRCRTCHSVGGSGGTVGPALDDYARYIAPIPLAQGMWNHGRAMQAEQAAQRIPMPIFVERELADLQEYIRETSNLGDRKVVLLQPPDPSEGRKLFTSRSCVRCHGSDGRGTAVAPDLRAATEHLQVAEIAGQLWNHSSEMAEVMRERGITRPTFENGEMADVIAFLFYLRFYETGGDVRVGELVFNRKGCSNCHMPAGRAAIGPDLSASEAVLTPLELATAMWNHAPAMYDRIQLEHVEWPSFQGDEMRDLSAFLASLAHRNNNP